MTILATDEITFLLTKNTEFIQESKLFENGGEYDPEEVTWYKEMLEEINIQLNEQNEKRK